MGSRPIPTFLRGRRQASTGPATFIAGRQPARRSAARSSPGFNEAGDVHRRKGLAVSPDLRHRRASTGPATFIAGRLLHAGDSMAQVRVLQRGRRRSSPEGHAGRRLAHHHDPGFNGAGDVHRRKAIAPMRPLVESAPLQRGRRRSSPEGDHRVNALAPGVTASTGPATVIAGRESEEQDDMSSTDEASTGPATFIAGRPRGPRAEGRRGEAASTGPATFVAGRGQRRLRQRQPGEGASTGPATFIAGRGVEVRLGAVAGRGASTGPATFIAGRAIRIRGTQPAGARASTGPATFIAGRISHRAPPLPGGRGFNGAGDVHRRKGASGGGRSRDRGGASTGPATFIAGRLPWASRSMIQS